MERVQAMATAAGQRVGAISGYQLLVASQVLLFIALLWVGGYWLVAWLERPLAQVKVQGPLLETDAEGLTEKVWAAAGNRYLALDLKAIQAALEAEPWVERVNPRRQWPAGVQVLVREQQPVARWGGGGLVNERGELFWPEENAAYSRLPALEGPKDKPLQMMAQYRALNQLIRPLNLRVAALKLEPRGAWSATLDNGIELLVGRGEVIDKISRFARVYGNQLMPYADKIKQVDLRYTNGLTVTWQQPSNSTPNNDGKA
ncbi:cell division protein FtsQ/DivIB [Motiliproteus sp. SC1-56]|uniref:cell division protein FtsQ/DivIB n=1 Tax=Motiliproteus sp. SC1-56 TaxID=2799565 RepID=UPI001A8D0BD9|nr:cell division protein FtsQ/DivIB [Motiliproteus sp. SC1-56]